MAGAENSSAPAFGGSSKIFSDFFEKTLAKGENLCYSISCVQYCVSNADKLV
jgi:hypothetical protein